MPEDDLNRLRRENEKLRAWLDLFVKENRILAWIVSRIVAGPRLAKSMEDWFATATLSNPLPRKESAAVATAIVRRFVGVGIFAILAFLVPNTLLYKQNLLIKDQNQYFREQIEELRRQVAIQEEQGDLSSRSALIDTIYDGKAKGISTRTRSEAVKAFVQLERKNINHAMVGGARINLRKVDLSCDAGQSPDCANLDGAWLVGVDFGGANLKGASFRGAVLTDSSFVGAELSNSDFSSANIEGALFRDLIVSIHDAIQAKNPALLPNVGRHSDGVAPLLEETYKVVSRLKVNLNIGVTRYARNSILLDYGIERVEISRELQKFMNELTNAAKVDGAIFPLSDLEYQASVDHYSRLPFGVVPYRAVQGIRDEIDFFERVSLIQDQADKLFGLYEVDIDVDKTGFACRRRDALTILTMERLEMFESLSLAKKEDFLREWCEDRFSFRSRGGVITKGSYRPSPF